MKLKSLIMFSAAALAFAACSNDNEAVDGSIKGNGVVEVKLVAPSTRAAVPGTGGAAGEDKVVVKGDITVVLTYAGTQTKEAVITQAEREGKSEYNVKFWDITNPVKVEAFVNDATKKYGDVSEVAVTEFANIMPENIPAYGVDNTITPKGETEVNGGKTYEMYEARVEMNIPVARLEVSGITHVTHTGEPDDVCKYATLTIDGIYLDKIKTTGDAQTVTDYHYPAVGTSGEAGYIPAPILWEAITSESFLQEGKVWPAAVEDVNYAYAFNFYPNGSLQMPLVKIYFAEATGNGEEVSQPRYAVIKSYNGETDFEFEAGKIYRITKVELADNNIIGDEEGNTLWGVDVTVVEAAWDVVDLSAEWVEDAQ